MQECVTYQNDEPEFSPDIYNRSIKAGFWVFLSRILQQLLAIGRSIILARLLLPDDIGVLGVALLTMSVLSHFTATGFHSALVQKKGDIREYLNSAWTIELFRCVGLFCILYVIAPYAAQFSRTPESAMIIRVMGVSLLFAAFSNIGTVYFLKELEFHKRLILQNAGTFVDVVVTIVCVVIYRNVWSFVFGKLAGGFVNFVLSYVMSPYRPALNFDTEKIKELWIYGKHVFATSIMKFLILEGDDIFVARVLGPFSLGLYRYAYKYANMAATEIGDIISQVTFPAYSKLQDNLVKLKGGYVKSLQVITLTAYPVGAGLIVLGYEFTGVVLGEKWLPMVPAMQILCLLGITKCMQGGNVFNSLGRPDLVKKISFVRLALIVITIYPLTIKYGLAGTSLSVFLSSAAIVPMLLYNVQKLTGHRIVDFFKLVSLPVIGSVIMAVVLILIGSNLGEPGVIVLLSKIVIGAAVYLATVFVISLFYKEYDLAALGRDIINGLKKK